MKQKILNYLKEIPYGKVTTYKNIAKKFSVHPRKVSMIMKYNQYPDIFPCYKVISSSGNISGYNTIGGVSEKIKKLEAEGIVIFDKKVDKKYII